MKTVNYSKIKNFIRFYDDQEIQSLNFIFGKNNCNNWFTQEELAFACDVNLLDRKNIENAKQNWLYKSFE